MGPRANVRSATSPGLVSNQAPTILQYLLDNVFGVNHYPLRCREWARDGYDLASELGPPMSTGEQAFMTRRIMRPRAITQFETFSRS